MKLTSEELKEYEEGVRLKLLGEIEKFVEEEVMEENDKVRLREFISKLK